MQPKHDALRARFPLFFEDDDQVAQAKVDEARAERAKEAHIYRTSWSKREVELWERAQEERNAVTKYQTPEPVPFTPRLRQMNWGE